MRPRRAILPVAFVLRTICDAVHCEISVCGFEHVALRGAPCCVIADVEARVARGNVFFGAKHYRRAMEDFAAAGAAATDDALAS